MAKPCVNGVREEILAQLEKKYGPSSGFWYNTFRKIPPEQFGVQKVSGKCLFDLEKLIESNKELHNIGIFLPMVLGGGPQYNNLPDYSKVNVLNGLRQTPDWLIGYLSEVAKHNLELVVNRSLSMGLDVQPFFGDVFVAKPHGFEIYEHENGELEKVDMGYVGDVIKVDTEGIIDAINHGRLPIISHIGRDTNGQFYNINATTAAIHLVQALGGYKLLILGSSCVERNGKRISRIRSEKEAMELVESGVITEGMGKNVRDAFQALPAMRFGGAVHIATPYSLVTELLTNGAGTIIRKPHFINTYREFEYIDRDFLKQLINKSFEEKGKKLVDDYCDREDVRSTVRVMYIDTNRTGGMILREIDGIPYACKIFTHPNYQGIGLATQVIEEAAANHGGLIFRTDKKYESTVNFYKNLVDNWDDDGKSCEGKISTYQEIDDYYIFCIKLDLDKWEYAKYKIAALPQTMVPLR